MATDYRERDPVLRLLPEDVPDVLATAEPAEAAFRGRLWLILWSAGYPQDMAWWLTYSPDEEFIADMREHLKTVPDENIPLMVQGRLKFDAGESIVPPGTVQ